MQCLAAALHRPAAAMVHRLPSGGDRGMCIDQHVHPFKPLGQAVVLPFLQHCRLVFLLGHSRQQPRSEQSAAAMASEQQQQQQPAREQVFTDAKWDAALDLVLRRAMYGTLAGGAAALLLLREFRSGCTVLAHTHAHEQCVLMLRPDGSFGARRQLRCFRRTPAWHSPAAKHRFAYPTTPAQVHPRPVPLRLASAVALGWGPLGSKTR